jgi:hypothetical protein
MKTIPYAKTPACLTTLLGGLLRDMRSNFERDPRRDEDPEWRDEALECMGHLADLVSRLKSMLPQPGEEIRVARIDENGLPVPGEPHVRSVIAAKVWPGFEAAKWLTRCALGDAMVEGPNRLTMFRAAIPPAQEGLSLGDILQSPPGFDPDEVLVLALVEAEAGAGTLNEM